MGGSYLDQATMTRAGILTKYRPGIRATRNGKSLMRAGKILQMVGKAQEMVGKGEANVRVDEKRIEGAREKKIGALGSPDHNTCGYIHQTLLLHFFID